MTQIKLLPKQEIAVWYLNQPHIREVKYGGAAGGGKSALGCLWLNSMAQEHDGSRWLMGRAKLKTLKQTTLNTFFELTSKLNCSNWFDYNQQAGEIKYRNGSVIILKDLFLYPSDPEFDSLGSLEVCGGFIDETAQITQKAWQISLSRCRYGLEKYNITPKMLGTCNPTKNYTYKEFYKPAKDGTIKEHRAFVQSLPTDNPHLPQSYLDSLLSLDEISKQRLYYGNWEYDDDPATLMDYDSIVDSFTNTHIPSGEKYISADIARFGKDKTIIMVWDGLRMIYMDTMPRSSIPDCCDAIKRLQKKYSVHNSKTIVDEDGVGGGVVDTLKCKGFVNGSRPIEQTGGLKNYYNLRSQGYFTLAKWVNDGGIFLSIKQGEIRDMIAEELEQIKQKDIDKDGKLAVIPKDEIKKNIGRSPDYADCIMMRMWFALKPIQRGAKVSIPKYS